MQPDPQTRQSPLMAGLDNRNRPGRRANSTTTIEPIASVSALLRHHANFVEVILCAICAGESVSLAGRRALAYTVERIRECAEVLNAR